MHPLISLQPVCRYKTASLGVIVCLIVSLFHSVAFAQTERVAGFQPRTFAVKNAKLIVSPGKTIDAGNLVVRDGMITAVGKDAAIPADADVIDGTGLFVYSGFIDAGTSDLLDAEKTPKPVPGRKVNFGRYVLAATRSDNRSSLTPDFRALSALKTDAAVLESFRKAGFTSVHSLPSGRVASGRGCLVSTSSAPLRETLLRESTFSTFQLFAPRGSNYPSTLMGATAHLRQVFLDAGRYAQHWQLYREGVENVERPPIDPALDALNQVLDGGRRAVFLAESRDDIHRALNFAEENDFSTILWGAREAYQTIDRLKKKRVNLIVQIDFGSEPKIERNKPSSELTADAKPPLRVQQDTLDRWKQRVAGLRELNEAKIRFAISSRGLSKRADLFTNLRLAIREGLSRDAALAALTIDAAAILKIENRLGSLEVGKLGHAVVMTGPFDHAQSKVRYLLVDGQKFEYNAKAKPVETDQGDAKPATDLVGKWNLTIDSAAGKVVAVLELTHKGKDLRGIFTSEQGNGTLTSGSVVAEQVEFVVAIGAGARTIRLKFAGLLKNNKLAGELKAPFGAATKWRAEREQASPAANNPVQLTLGQTGSSTNSGPVVAENPETEQLPTELESDRLHRPIQTGGNVLIKNATVLTGTKQTLPATSILVKDGKIAAIGGDLQAEPGMQVIDATGRYVMPGIIDTHSHIKITSGTNESTQSIVAEVRIKDVIRTTNVSEYRALAGGVSAVRILHGSANVIGGQDAVVKLKYGATADEQILHDAPQGVKFALGENVKFRTTRFPNTRLGVEATLNRAFLEAVDYRRQWMEYDRRLAKLSSQSDKLLPPRRDLRLEALADIVNHKKFIHCHCYRADEILMLLRTAENLGIRVWSLQHVLEGYKVAPEIVAHGASCSTFSDWWAYKVEAYDAIPYNAALLKEAGANIVIKSDNAELLRHLYLEAAKTVRYGNMHPDDALQTVTLNAARELGLDERMGSIEVGKDADLAIFNGHPLSGFSRCEMTLIEGEVYFSREQAPSAMSPAAAKHSATPPTLAFPSQEIRRRKLDLTVSANGRYAITGATLHPVDAPAIAGGTLIIENGKIAALGKDVAIPSDAKTVAADGLHVYPGMIDAGTTLGLVEIGKVRETQDYNESGGYQPDLRAGIAINPDSELIPVARAGGITTVLVRPTGGVISGQASLVKLSGWTAPEMVLDYEAGLQINWPRRSAAEKTIKELSEFLAQGRQYSQLRAQAKTEKTAGPISDPRLEALQPYLNGEKPVFIEAESRKQIAEALLFAEKEKLKIVITGGTDAWKLAGELKKRDVPVIVGPVMRAPVESHDPFDAPYANAGRLHEAGVRFCIRSNNASNSRNTPFEAAMAVAYGLPEEQGLRAVTLSAAEILGIDEQVGSLTVGKLANLVIADGSPLQQTAQIKGVFIEGRPHPPVNRQTRFYERYRQRLKEVRTQERKVTGK